MGGSILPVAIHNNKVYFLFGKEKNTKITKKLTVCLTNVKLLV